MVEKQIEEYRKKQNQKFKIKRRPRRLFYDDKSKKYFYLINNKKKYIKINKEIPAKAIANINIQNILPVSVRRKSIRPRTSIKPITNQQIITKLVPIAPISQNLSERYSLYKPSDDLEKKLTKLEQQIKTKDIKETEVKDFRPLKSPKPTTLIEFEKGRRESEEQLITDIDIQEKLKKDIEEKRKNDMNAVYRGFVETNPPADLEDEGDVTFMGKMLGQFKSKKKHVTVKDFLDQAIYYSGYPEFPPFEWFSVEIFPKLTGFNKPSKEKWREAKEFYDDYAKMKPNITLIDDDSKEEIEPILKTEGNITTFGRGISTFMNNMSGSGMYENDDDGIFNTELQEIFKDKMNKFLPVIPADKMDELLPLVNKDTKKFGWIQNTEPENSMGRHWVAYFIDVPNLEVNYYDSLTENEGEPPKESLKGLKKIIDKIHPEYYLLFKYNTIQQQSFNSKNCGYFALKFILDRYRNIDFKVASGFDKNYYEGEKMIKRFKKYL
jgi:hypothetical protein